MSYPISGCVFIRNTFSGGYALPESLAQFMSFCDEMIIGDYGSTDGTVEFLNDLASHNPKVKPVFFDSFPLNERGELDANAFAVVANDLVAMCTYDNVIYWQSDEIWHEDLLRIMQRKFEAGKFDLSFWRIQYANNFQYVKWFPHLVHRVGTKGDDFNEGKRNFEFVGDGMNTTRSWDAAICSNYGGEMFEQWGGLGQFGIRDFTNEMITDVSLLGAFRDLIPDRRRMHAPFWHEEPTIPYYNKTNGQQLHMVESEWYAKALGDEDWTKTQSPYNLPKLLQWHVGKTRYELQPGLVEALRSGNTNELIGL